MDDEDLALALSCLEIVDPAVQGPSTACDPTGLASPVAKSSLDFVHVLSTINVINASIVRAAAVHVQSECLARSNENSRDDATIL